MDLENTVLSVVSQTEKDKYYMISVVLASKVLQNEFMYKTLKTDSHRKQTQWGKGGWKG